MNKKLSSGIAFNSGDFVVYPAHGVGRVTEIGETVVAGQSLELIAINFTKEKLTLRIPLINACKTGLREVASEETMAGVVAVLSGKSKTRRIQWSKRFQEYTVKINSYCEIYIKVLKKSNKPIVNGRFLSKR